MKVINSCMIKNYMYRIIIYTELYSNGKVLVVVGVCMFSP